VNTVEKAASTAGLLVVVFGAGAAWNSLANRIDKVDDKIAAIQKTLGSTPCTAILTRQLAAIDKGRADVRKALDSLSGQYSCVSGAAGGVPADFTSALTPLDASQAAALKGELNAVDFQLERKRR
jgi:hypothetical protein